MGMRCAWAVILVLSPAGAAAGDEVVKVFDRAEIHWDEESPEIVEDDGFVVRFARQTVEKKEFLPAAPENQREALRIVARVRVEPQYSILEGRRRPNDPWPRLGTISVVAADTAGRAVETEIMRFVTGFGAEGTFEQDVTALAPLLHGERTIRAFVSSYSEKPGWWLSLSLTYTRAGRGPRRPVFARGVLSDLHVTADDPRLRAAVRIPSGLDHPRLRVTATGHATDGGAANEFVSCPIVLRIDGREVARWRPWSEAGGGLRRQNPWAARWDIDGRELRSSDLDRSGWQPALVVEPMIFPAAELTPGTHDVELVVEQIRPKDPPGEDGKRHHGYWAVSAIVVADEPWPQ